VFVSHRDGQFEVYQIDRDGSRPRNLSNHHARDTFPTWMPDGQAILLVSEREGSPDLYIRHVAR
jgi:TolB protein